MTAFICQKCGYSRKGNEPGFKLMGGGWVRCPKCQALHFAFERFPPSKDNEDLMLMLY